jgi:uncharacterized protein (DUF1697 family)
MSMRVALLRGINVGGHNRIAMSDLRDLLGALGFAGAKLLLQSGNLIFESDGRTGADLECLPEVETSRRLDVTADYLVRAADEWQAVVAGNPVPGEAKRGPGHLVVMFLKTGEAKRGPGHLVVMFLKTAPRAKDVQALQAAIERPESVRAEGRHLYVAYPAASAARS